MVTVESVTVESMVTVKSVTVKSTAAVTVESMRGCNYARSCGIIRVTMNRAWDFLTLLMAAVPMSPSVMVTVPVSPSMMVTVMMSPSAWVTVMVPVPMSPSAHGRIIA